MIYDLIVVGGGPAGLTAAVYARRANKTVLVLEKETFGGQITSSPKVENIPGFSSLSGSEFGEKLLDQALYQGAEVDSAEVLKITDGKVKTVVTDAGDFQAKAVVLATGAKHRLLGLEKEESFVGNGISFCAVCDGAYYAGKDVAVIGGGNSALQEAVLLADTASSVTIVQNLDFLTGEKKLAEDLSSRANVKVLLGTVVDAYLGGTELKGLRVKEVKTGNTQDLSFDGVFVAIGLVPQNEPFQNVATLDERGYVDANETCRTKTEGVFVAGDCRKKAIRQVTTAAADGAIAALNACDYIDSLEK